jgi:dihydrofolate reductase
MEIVVAAAENDVIGRANRLPWRLSADLRRFKSLTLGKPVLMGRKTYESIGRALPGRTNLVLSHAQGFAPSGCTVVASLDAARAAAIAAAAGAAAPGAAAPGTVGLDAALRTVVVGAAAFGAAGPGAAEHGGAPAPGTDAVLMVIGGAQVYRQCLPFVSRIHLTLVHARIEDGDTFFDGWRGAEWRETFREDHEADAENSCAYSFVTLERS